MRTYIARFNHDDREVVCPVVSWVLDEHLIVLYSGKFVDLNKITGKYVIEIERKQPPKIETAKPIARVGQKR